jgi:carboxymethylenebutenolidase
MAVEQQLTVTVPVASFPLVLATPARTPAPAVICVPSIFGVTPEAHRWLDQYTQAGFLTAVYDPFWRTDPGPLSPLDDSERARARARRDIASAADATSDLAAVIGAVRALPACTGKVAVAGYCFGGRYAFVAAARLPIDAAVSFHGILVGRSIEVAPEIRAPIQLHYGGVDPEAPMSEIDALRAATAGNPNVEIDVYPGVGHSFTWRNYPKFHPEAAAKSEARALELLETLR